MVFNITPDGLGSGNVLVLLKREWTPAGAI